MPRKKKVEAVVAVPAGPLKLDLGCGKNKREGFIGVDVIAFPGVDVVANLAKDKWPWADGTVDEIHASHFVEHLKPKERVHFANEAYRVLKEKASVTMITPHWAASRAYGDLTHEWPPVSEFWGFYLNAGWREVNAPHNTEYTCDFDLPVTAYTMHPMAAGRSQDWVNFATQAYKEVCQDMMVTLIKGSRVKALPPPTPEVAPLVVKRKRGRPRKNPLPEGTLIVPR